LRHKNGVYFHISINRKVLLKNLWIFVILLGHLASEIVGDKCSSFEMMKGCMVRKRSETPSILDYSDEAKIATLFQNNCGNEVHSHEHFQRGWYLALHMKRECDAIG